MADIGGEAAGGFLAKAGAAGATGALWGIFATALLVIPSIIMGLFAPVLKKGTDKISEKLNQQQAQGPQAKQEVQKSKADRDYQRKLAALNAQREEEELAEKLAMIKARRQRNAANQGTSRNVTI
jgi:hypothetical protein